METQAGTRWKRVETELDDLWFPEIEIAHGGASEVWLSLVGGSHPSDRKFDGNRFYSVRFQGAEFLCVVEERVYWSVCEESDRPSAAISEIENSKLLEKIRPHIADTLKHFLVCGGNVCCEVIAYDQIEVARHPSRSAANSAPNSRVFQ